MVAASGSPGLRPPYRLDPDFYDRVRAERSGRSLVEEFSIPPFNGQAFKVSRGQSFRVIQEEGPQCGDVALWNADDLGEAFSSPRTWAMEGWFITRHTRLWSQLPSLRPMATCIDDSLASGSGDYHYHCVATHCSPEVTELLGGPPGTNACRLNLLQAVEPFGLSEADLRDNIDVFWKNRLDPVTGQFFVAPNDGSPGDFVEFYAEMDLLVAVSVCPSGDGTRNWAVPSDGFVKPLGIQVYDIGVPPRDFPSRRSSS